jgi:predicted GIY-YIG superfamily endonuclease
MACYLIHFSAPISPAHTCQHYLGSAHDIARRLAEHRAGKGARLTAVAVERGIRMDVVARWPGGRALERKLKARHNSRRLCPVCNPGSGHALPW